MTLSAAATPAASASATNRPALSLGLSPMEQIRAGRLPRRLVQLTAGLWLYGASMAIVIRGALGLDPWDVFHAGVMQRVGLSFGTVVIIVGALVLLLWIPLRQAPGLGTIANVVLIGVATDATLAVLAAPDGFAARAAFLVGGIIVNGLAGALYIGAQLGPGPRDGLMTGLVRRTGLSVRLVRTTLELTVLGVGFLLGGQVGLGTLLYAVSIGPLVQFFLRFIVVGLDPREARGSSDPWLGWILENRAGPLGSNDRIGLSDAWR
jgi:uncharacterized membrane protein YczE